jgi:hypothetical protein
MKTLETLYAEVLASNELKAAFIAAVKENDLAGFLKAQGCEAGEAEAEEFIRAKQTAEGELTDDELDAVAGGGCNTVEEAKSSESAPPSALLVATIVNICG